MYCVLCNGGNCVCVCGYTLTFASQQVALHVFMYMCEVMEKVR